MLVEAVWEMHYKKLRNYIAKKVSDSHEAEDILQEVGLRLIKNQDIIQELDNIEAWLYRVTQNTIIDYYRRKDRLTYSEDIETLHTKDAYLTESENYNAEAASCLLKLTDYLPENYKKAIIESDYKGIQQNLLSEVWQLSYSGTKNRVQRARKKLKETLLQCCEVKSDKKGNIIELENKNVLSEEFSLHKLLKSVGPFHEISVYNYETQNRMEGLKMQTLRIEWQHLDVEGETCDRCYDTGENLNAEVTRLNRKLESKGIRVEWFETKLDETQISFSNTLLFNGVPIEEILEIKVAENYCESCSELLGNKTYCRTVFYDGGEYEDIPAKAIREATYKVLNISKTEDSQEATSSCSCCSDCGDVTQSIQVVDAGGCSCGPECCGGTADTM